MNSARKITPVILCGGSGTRLWPLSRKSFPKQFAPVVNDKSPFQLTVERLAPLAGDIKIIASEEHRFIITDILNRLSISGDLLLEPEPKNTAAAMAIAALHKSEQLEDLLLFCPADHFIPDREQFITTINLGIEEAMRGAIVTFGITPNFPSSAYGYIRKGSETPDGNFKVEAFVEKPDDAKAREFLLEGNMLWNAGIFLCKRKTLLEALKNHSPETHSICQIAMATATQETFKPNHNFIRPNKDVFTQSPSNSIDYAVMERHENVIVVPFKGQWSDIGSWNAVADLTTADEQQNRILGNGLACHSENTYIYAPNRLVVSLGTKDLMIIDTPDAVLVVERTKTEQVKEVWHQLEEQDFKETTEHRKIYRPWGWYDTVDEDDRFRVKRICVKPGASLSLQQHHHRAEHWVVVKGTAKVTRGEVTFLLSENQSTYIPIGMVHRLMNPCTEILEMIEIQSGHYLGEDDILRLEDTYGRAKQSDIINNNSQSAMNQQPSAKK
ncbi:MAG: xanthan biosynthesis protein XanB [Rhodomicrobium sp.]|nr:MAG: xanthan biosynthesis protein XanB [Rhodomicrobium sp.]